MKPLAFCSTEPKASWMPPPGPNPVRPIAGQVDLDQEENAMSDKTTELKDELKKNLERLQTLRDEVRVHLHLATMEAKDEWNKLEPHLAGAEKAAETVSEASRQVVAKALQKLEAFRHALK
jgi:hypothetical protein